MNEPGTLLVVALALSLLGIALLGVRVVSLTRERQGLRQQLRRVLRAGVGTVEAREIELGQYHALFTALPLPVLVTDQKRRLIAANPAAEAIFGRIEVGEGAIERLRHHLLEAVIVQALEEGESEAYSIELPGERQYICRAFAWPLSEGTARGALLLLEDVTEMNRLARARRDMVANLSHELRTPLTSIRLMTETLLEGALLQGEGQDDVLASKFVGRIAAENEALIRLVDDLTTLAWIERGRTPLRMEPSNLRELVAQRIQRLSAQAERKGIHILLESPTDPVTALDVERFGQVITNLLDNAIKFSPEEGTIRVTIQQEGKQPEGQERPEGTVSLTIRDEGPGILPQDLPRIFERFYKGDRVRTRSNASGTGLGLAIARHLVEAHGGTIRAESKFGQGAIFVVTLPE